MAVTNGNDLNNPAAPAVVNVDPTALANALIAAGLKVPQTAQVQAPRSSKLQETFARFEKDENNDQATLNGIKELLTAHGEDIRSEMNETQKQELYRALQDQQYNSTVRLIEMQVGDYIADDEMLVEYKGLLKDKVINEFNNNPKYETARQRYGKGDVDIDLLKKISIEEINKFNKARGVDKKVKGPTGMKNSDDGLADTAEAAERSDSGEILNPKEFDSKERDLYNARLGTCQRLGMKRDSDDAKKSASMAVRKLRQGEAKAKARGYQPLNRR